MKYLSTFKVAEKRGISPLRTLRNRPMPEKESLM